MTTPPFGAPAPAPAAAPFGGGQPQAAAPATAPFGGGQAPQQGAPPATGSPWSVPSETSSGDLFPAQELNGALLLFTPKEYRTGVTTVHGVKDVVVADVAVIGARKDANGNWQACPPEQSELLENNAVFSGFLIGALKGKVNNGMVLGKLYQGPATQGNPPWMLADPTEADKAAAMAYYNANQSAPPF